MITCSLEDALRIHNSSVPKAFNYIYMRPPSEQELEKRLQKSKLETFTSINIKKGKMVQDMAIIGHLDWIDHIFIAEDEDQILRDIPNYLFLHLYKVINITDSIHEPMI
jgi:guanylate kinase